MNKPLQVSLDKLSYTAIPLKLTLLSTKQTLYTATGFIYSHVGKYYLITNWHVVSGRNPYTGKTAEHGGVPDNIEFPLHKPNKSMIKWNRLNLTLRKKKNNKPDWLVHPTLGNKVDVVAIPIDSPIDTKFAKVYPINEQDFDKIKPTVGDDVFILGFPDHVPVAGNFPIWKRGTISTEPDIDHPNKEHEQLPRILVDTASRPGMSGSPVICRRFGVHGLVNGEVTGESIIGEAKTFIGIYSGRINTNTELDSQLGVVWKEKAIIEIIQGKCYDS